VAIRPPKYNAQGFTLVEMLVVLIITGIVMGLALPTFSSLNKPLRNGSLQFKSQLALIRSKAIASNQSYRIRPRYITIAQTIAAHSDPITSKPDRSYPQAPNNFVVEYAANCNIATTGGTSGWQAASQLDLDLPVDVGITDKATSTFGTASGPITVDNSLNWAICFDNRGIIDPASRKQIVLKDFQGSNKAEITAFDISAVGGVDMFTYAKNPSLTPSYPLGTTLVDDAASPTPNPVF
jgi:prepilin-type N-terminal cleavage/methylation domain-containing protein